MMQWEMTKQEMTRELRTTHIAVYDLPNKILFVSNTRADSESGPLHAYDRYAM